MERMEAQCQKYRVIQRLCEEDETDYHRYLFSLLDSLSTNSMDPIQFILTELKRYEPQAVQAIDHTLQFICLMNRTMLVYDVRSFFQFSSETPLTIRFVEEAWTDYLRERVTEPAVPLLKEVCRLVEVDACVVDRAFVWSRVVYPEKEGISVHAVLMVRVRLDERCVVCSLFPPPPPPGGLGCVHAVLLLRP